MFLYVAGTTSSLVDINCWFQLYELVSCYIISVVYPRKNPCVDNPSVGTSTKSDDMYFYFNGIVNQNAGKICIIRIL